MPSAVADLLLNKVNSVTAMEAGIHLGFFSSTDLHQLTSTIPSSKSSTCLNPIQSRLLKETLPLNSPSLLDMINLSLSIGYVPESLKVAVIKPLLQKPIFDPEVLVNYRPISNLLYISKIQEKAFTNLLCDFLHNHSLFGDFQSGFRVHHSTENPWAKVTSDLLLVSEEELVYILVLLDFSTAFDTIDHEILLHRLEHLIGIRGTALIWFKSYLSDSFQFVHVDDKRSICQLAMEFHKIKCLSQSYLPYISLLGLGPYRINHN